MNGGETVLCALLGGCYGSPPCGRLPFALPAGPSEFGSPGGSAVVAIWLDRAADLEMITISGYLAASALVPNPSSRKDQMR
jgi:hypothetical protein